MHTLQTHDPVICVIPSIFSQFKVPVLLQNWPGLVQVFIKHMNMQDNRNEYKNIQTLHIKFHSILKKGLCTYHDITTGFI
jgi:hypothetical protein